MSDPATTRVEITAEGSNLSRPAELWMTRDLLLILAGRDIKLRYRQTVLGAAWVVVQPLLAAAIFAFIFGRVARLPSEGVPYFVFAFTGFVLWNFISQVITRVTASLVGNAHLVSKVFFPRLVLPLASALSSLLDLAVASCMLGALLVLSRQPLSPEILLAPLWILVALAFALGTGLIAAALVVSYRDVQHVLPVALQLLLFISPVAYATTAIPSGTDSWYSLNPLVGVVEGFRASLLASPPPTLSSAAYAIVATLALVLLGVVAFTRMERQFADVI
ncbi:MAG TPA: ABC transporter permease [Acidimicrobiales bacterium]|nr:ABC transporter permease [Acidimicrobiales bacterium]